MLTVSNRGGVWEGSWEGLRETALARIFSQVSRRAVEAAIRGHDRPLRQALGIVPEGALRKLPSRECQERSRCTFYDKRKCLLLSSKMPWCFKPDGLHLSEPQMNLVSEALAHWKQGVYVVVVDEDL